MAAKPLTPPRALQNFSAFVAWSSTANDTAQAMSRAHSSEAAGRCAYLRTETREHAREKLVSTQCVPIANMKETREHSRKKLVSIDVHIRCTKKELAMFSSESFDAVYVNTTIQIETE